jgi:hypothetical protein
MAVAKMIRSAGSLCAFWSATDCCAISHVTGKHSTPDPDSASENHSSTGIGNSSFLCLTSSDTSKQEMAEIAIDDCESIAAKIGRERLVSPRAIQLTHMWVSRTIS